MRVFSVEPDGGFTEYEQLPFETDHAEADLEQWLEANPDGILEDGPLLIIGRQVPTDLGKAIDLLGVDREGNVVVVELKRDRTPRDVVAQALGVRRVRRESSTRPRWRASSVSITPTNHGGLPSSTASTSISRRPSRSTRTSAS